MTAVSLPMNGGGAWIRWSVGLILAGLVSVLGFAWKESSARVALEQHVHDYEQNAARDRQELRSDMKDGFASMNMRLDGVVDLIIPADDPSPMTGRRQRPKVMFPHGQMFDK